MTLSEKSAYLKGLMEGLKLDTEKAEGKMISEIVDLLSEVALSISDLESNDDTIFGELGALEEQIDALCDFDDEEDDDDYEFDDDELYEIKCPTCGKILTIDGPTFEEGSIKCPHCGEELEFDLDEEPEADGVEGVEGSEAEEGAEDSEEEDLGF